MTGRSVIGFCTTCKGRTQHLEQTLPRNLSDNPGPDCRFVLLDYNSGDHLAHAVAWHHRHAIAVGRLIVYSFRDPGPFRMAHSKNMAHRLAMREGCEILCNLDADAFTGGGFSEWIQDQFAQYGRHSLLQAMWNRWLTRDVDGKPVTEWVAQAPDGTVGAPIPKGANGRIVMTSDAFLKAGGYDERINKWGPDDKDLTVRLRRLGYQPQLIERRFLGTILHNDKVRYREYPEAAQTKAYGFDLKVGDSPDTIANWGALGCGTVYRNFDFHDPVVLAPIPTRIFGIGMHKTATTSLHRALRTLGLDSAHWTTAHWAKACWTEMKELGRSPSIERHYCASDLPIALLYRELDRAYPGSLFILTIRHEATWIESVRRHWDPASNPFRGQWDHDPFTHRVHQELYGTRAFDAGRMLERYRRHNAEVLDYFRARPRDLLVMDMDNGAGWPQLCGRLGEPIPSLPYPWEFANNPKENP